MSACCAGAWAQPAPAAAPTDLSAPLASLQHLTPDITQTLDSIHWQHWKLKGDEKTADDRALTSLHSDLDRVLPGLLRTAQASPGSVSAGLAVYRNVNALYNVLLRLQQTAELIAKDDAPPLEDALGRLEVVRNALGEQLQAMAQQQETALVHARAALADKQEEVVHPRHIVVDDAAPAHKKTTSKPATAKSSKAKPIGTKTTSKKPSAVTAAQ